MGLKCSYPVTGAVTAWRRHLKAFRRPCGGHTTGHSLWQPRLNVPWQCGEGPSRLTATLALLLSCVTCVTCVRVCLRVPELARLREKAKHTRKKSKRIEGGQSPGRAKSTQAQNTCHASFLSLELVSFAVGDAGSPNHTHAYVCTRRCVCSLFGVCASVFCLHLGAFLQTTNKCPIEANKSRA